jgi:hypothetical protein
MSAAGDSAGKSALRIVSTSRVPGGNRIVYEVVPSQTVTLLELDTTKLSEVVVTNAAILAAPVSPPARLEENTIRWKEAATGKELVLSGRFPIEELQRIRLRIERERADRRGKTP